MQQPQVLRYVDFIFPVKADISNEIFGTAFRIGENLFLTAGHVINNIIKSKANIEIGIPEGNYFIFLKVSNYYINTDFDFAVIECVVRTEIFTPDFKDWSNFLSVKTIGYPYSFDFQNKIYSVRTFMGYIVLNGEKYFDLKGTPKFYELSFSAPKGLSGAPLISNYNAVSAYIIGNRQLEQIVSKVVEKDGTQVFESRNYMSLGIAIQIESILNVKIDFARKTMKEIMNI